MVCFDCFLYYFPILPDNFITFTPMEFLRTPDSQFANLPDWPYTPRYISIDGMRMHYVDEGEGDIILCLHGEPSWSYLYRKFIPILSPHARIIAPDWFGFGRSDKPKRVEDYTYAFHLRTLGTFLDELDLQNITVVVQDWGGLLGLGMVGQQPERFKRVVIMNTFLPVGDRPANKAFTRWRWFALNSPILPIGQVMKFGTVREASHSKAVLDAYRAPFPSAKYKAGARAFPAIVPLNADEPGVAEMKQARAVLAEWQKPCLVLFSDQDPITGPARRFFAEHIPTAEEIEGQRVKNAGHFLQEDAGEEIAGHIHAFMQRHP